MAKASKKKTTRKTPRKKAAKKAMPRRKTSTKKATRKKVTKKVTRKKTPKKRATAKSSAAMSIEKLSGGARKLMLANLGLYGTVLDELQAQAARASKVINKARSNPTAVNKDLVERGEALADQITDLLKRSGAPASQQLKKQIEELRSATRKLRRTIGR